MEEENPARPGNTGGQESFETLKDIRRMMERSSRFISLSGLSGIAAGICALAGAWFAKQRLDDYYAAYESDGFTDHRFYLLKVNLFIIAMVVLAAAWIAAFYFTWRKAKHNRMPVWDVTARRLTINILIPLVTGGLFIMAFYQQDAWSYIAPACLVFYGLALVNASKYTLTDIRYLGFCEIILGLIGTQYVEYGLYFWAAGFGLLHIIYGFTMWWKYERKD